MLKHYIKIAFRNLWKYKGQTLVSVAGLAVGFVCFAMGALWIRYEMTFDSFHKNAERMYSVYQQIDEHSALISLSSNMAGYLKATFPEVARSTAFAPMYDNSTIKLDSVEYSVEMVGVDSSFFEMFDVGLVEGSMDFIIPEHQQIAVTREKALQLFGSETPVGKRVEYQGKEYTIGAVVRGFPKHSNYPFDFMKSDKEGYQVIIELASGIDVEAFKKKLYEHTVSGSTTTHLSLMPLTSLHYKDIIGGAITKRVQHTMIFSFAGLLLIGCTLFNYFTLFISRFKIRQREFALRVVFGASTASLFTLLLIEFLVSMIVALLLGLLLVDILSPAFVALSSVRLSMSAIYSEILIYIAAIILISSLTFLVTLAVFRRKELNVAIHSRNRKLFRKTSIIVQLTVSIAFAFCTIVILKQMYHLHNTDLGFELKNSGSVILKSKYGDKIDALEQRIKQIPEITATIKGVYPVIYYNFLIFTIKSWDGKSDDDTEITMYRKNISEEFQKFYGLRLIEGDFLTDSDEPGSVLINESAQQTFGWHNAVGKSFGNCKVKGVIKNINISPTYGALPSYYSISRDKFSKTDAPAIIFNFDTGAWISCKSKIEAIVKELCPDVVPTITSTEEEYDKLLTDEKNPAHCSDYHFDGLHHCLRIRICVDNIAHLRRTP